MPKTYRAVLVIAGDRELAADATAEGFAEAWTKWPKLDEPSAYVCKVAYNYIKKYWKRIKNREILTSSPKVEEGDLTAEALAGQAPDAAERDLDLLKAVADLPEQQRAVMAGRYILDLRPIDVAEALGIKRQTESEYHRRALLTLHERLADWRTNE
jgi:RNA polymerase sigma factor (sigma-70 family)